ncbi:OmpA family protein [Thioalkalivibrio sp. ALJ24]|uniref:OmpA family protein n=1 Tax=Thioalkalivibrio sp. ALJ24 TaxID=545276 RepID=UPI000364D24F|nr:OmpA family protein [Thioalkalivibrio sp. ALJ24]
MFLAIPTAAGTLFQESLERSDWTRVEIDDLCRLQQEVRNGGTLQFETRPGLAVRAFWDPPGTPQSGDRAPLETGAPEWLPAGGPEPLALTLRAGPDGRFRVPDARVAELKSRLLAGQDVRIGFPDSDNIVHFRAIRFGRRIDGFRACRATHDPAPEATDSEPARERWVVYFDSGRVDLDADARAVLETAVATLEGVEGPRLRVTGLTDGEGPDRLNRRISRQRAEGVREVLEKAGLRRAEIEVEGAGVAPGVDGEDADARRAEILWLGEREGAEDRPAPEPDPGDEPAPVPQPVEPGGGTGW